MCLQSLEELRQFLTRELPRGEFQTSSDAQTPPDLVVDHWTSDVESSSPLDFRLLHAMWTPFGCLMSYKIRPIISVVCDFTTKSGGICGILPRLLQKINGLQRPEPECPSGPAEVGRASRPPRLDARPGLPFSPQR